MDGSEDTAAGKEALGIEHYNKKIRQIVEDEGKETIIERDFNFIDSDIEDGTADIEVDEEGNVVMKE